tara:strand:+ start:534 stop:749 length:216 start_codon:yes stop_codon:yes gene_type:complete
MTKQTTQIIKDSLNKNLTTEFILNKYNLDSKKELFNIINKQIKQNIRLIKNLKTELNKSSIDTDFVINKIK